MSEVVEKKKQPSVPINDKFRLTSDGRFNLITEILYEKKESAGKGAKGTGILESKPHRWHGKSIKSLAKIINEEDIIESFSDLDEHKNLLEQINILITYLEEREERIYEHFNKHITLKLGGYKGKDVDE